MEPLIIQEARTFLLRVQMEPFRAELEPKEGASDDDDEESLSL